MSEQQTQSAGASAAANGSGEQEWRAAAERVRNWGKWGEEDQAGTLNYITPERLSHACSLAKQGRAIPVGVPFSAYGPQGASGFRRNPIHLMTVDGGDENLAKTLAGWGGTTEGFMVQMYEMGPMRFTDDFIIMPLGAGTHWDSIAHVYYDGLMYNGVPASAVTSFGATKNGIDKIGDRGGVIGRGVLLDVARHLGVNCLEPSFAISPELLEEVCEAQGVEVGEGDVLIVRTGWWTNFVEHGNPDTWLMESPGLSWRCAEWMHDRRVAAVNADNPALEVMPPELGVLLLLHMLTIRDMGMTIGQGMDLEALGRDCAEDNVYEFLLVAPVLNVPGGAATPISPVAIK